jgi:chromosome segregation ATPase
VVDELCRWWGGKRHWKTSLENLTARRNLMTRCAGSPHSRPLETNGRVSLGAPRAFPVLGKERWPNREATLHIHPSHIHPSYSALHRLCKPLAYFVFFPRFTILARMAFKRKFDAPQTSVVPQSRLSRYYGGEVRLSSTIRDQIQRGTEVELRTEMALTALQTKHDSAAEEIYMRLATLKTSKESYRRCKEIVTADLQDMRDRLLRLKNIFQELETDGPVAKGFEKKSQKLLTNFQRLQSAYYGYWPQLQAAHNTTQSNEIDRLRDEIKVIRSDQEMAQKLLMATCRREGSIANALVGNKIRTPSSASDFVEITQGLNWLMMHARNERRDQLKELHAAGEERRQHQETIGKLQETVKKLEEEKSEAKERERQHQTESTLLTNERKSLKGAQDAFHQSVQQSVTSISRREAHIHETTAYTKTQLAKSGEECHRLNDENDKLREEIDELKKLRHQVEAAHRFEALLKDTIDELARLRNEYDTMSVSMKDVERSDAELRNTNMALQKQCNEILLAKEQAQREAAAARETATEHQRQVREYAVMTTKSMEQATGANGVWHRSLDIQENLHKQIQQLSEDRVRTLKNEAIHTQSHHLREVERLNNQIFELQQRSEALEALRDNEIQAHACTKSKVAFFRWYSASKSWQVTKISEWNKMYSTKLGKKRAELKEAYSTIKSVQTLLSGS